MPIQKLTITNKCKGYVATHVHLHARKWRDRYSCLMFRHEPTIWYQTLTAAYTTAQTFNYTEKNRRDTKFTSLLQIAMPKRNPRTTVNLETRNSADGTGL